MGKKRRIAILLAAALAAVLAGCGAQAPTPTESTVQTTAPTAQTDPTQQTPTTGATEEVSYQAPDFTVYDLEGDPHRLSDYFGKPIVLNFWASWCGPCKSEMPDFEKVYQELGEQVQFFVVNLTDGSMETVDTAYGYIQEQGYTFPVFYDTDYDAASTYGISSIPTSFFIDSEGDLVAYYTGAMNEDLLRQGIGMICPD